MGKKIAALLLVLLLAGSSAVLALEEEPESTFAPGDTFYDAFIDLKTSQGELTGDLLEKALLLSELADQLVEAIMSETDINYLDELLQQLNLTEADIVELMAAYYEDGEPEDGEPEDGEPEEGEPEEGEPEDEVEFGCSQRGWRLREKVADESLPEHVRANAQKALDNQARAREHHAWAKSGQQGPPPWANSRHNRVSEENSENNDASNGESGENGAIGENGETLEQDNDGENLPLLEKNQDKAQNKIKNKNQNKNKNKNKNGKPGKGWGRENAPGQLKKQ